MGQDFAPRLAARRDEPAVRHQPPARVRADLAVGRGEVAGDVTMLDTTSLRTGTGGLIGERAGATRIRRAPTGDATAASQTDGDGASTPPPDAYVVGAVDDPAERVADHLADIVVSGGSVGAVRHGGARIRRAATAPGDDAAGRDGGVVGAGLGARIDRARSGGGRPLGRSTRRSLEGGFERDLSDVRVHTGAEASSLNDALHARAFTAGSDVFFAGGEYRPDTPSGMRLLAHETAHVVTGDHSVRRSARTVIRRTYSALSVPDRARVDALAERTYAAKAEEFEYKLGKRLEQNPHAIQITDVLLDRVKDIVDAWASATGRSKTKAYKEEFSFADGDKYYGAFQMTGSAIKHVFDDRSQPMRKKLKIVYNAVRNSNLPKWLKVAADDLAESERVAAERLLGHQAKAKGVHAERHKGRARLANGGVRAPDERITVKPGFAAASGLDAVLQGDAALRGRVDAASQREAVTRGSGAKARKVHVGAEDMWSSFSRGSDAQIAEMDLANRSRQYGQNEGVGVLDQQVLERGDVADLTSDEIRQLNKLAGRRNALFTTGSDKRKFKAKTTDKMPWEQGREAYRVMDNSAVDRTARSIKARLEAGVSGSTNMMLVASQNLGVSDLASLQKLRLAMLGWMLPNHDHSFYEIMTAAENQGVPFDIDPTEPGAQYERAGNFTPEPVAGLQNVLPENQFPRWFLSTAHKDVLSGAPLTAEKGATPVGQTVKEDRRALRADLKALGIGTADRNALDMRSKIELQKLGRLIQATTFENEQVTNPKATKQANLRAKAVARNRLHHRRLRDDAAYQYLVHEHPARTELWFNQLLHHAGKPVSPGGDLIRDGGAALPAVAADDAVGLRAQLQADGIPASVAAGLDVNVLVDLMHLKAMSSSLAGGGYEALLDRVKSTPYYARLSAVIGSGPFAVELINTATGMWATGAAAGIPASLLRSIWPFQLAKVLDSVLPEVHRIAGLAANQQENALVQVGALFAPTKTWIDGKLGANRFDLLVAALARVEGVTLAGTTHFTTLSKAAQVLGPETITGPTTQAESGLMPAFINQASDTVDANVNLPDTRASLGLDQLLPHEIAAINKYTRLGGMGAWQDAMTTLDTTNKGASDKLTKLAPTMRAAVAGLGKLPAYNQPCYGAQRTDLAGKPADAMRIFQKGSVHPQSNFFSMSETIDDSFIPKAQYGVAWVIRSGHGGKQIDKISTNQGEREVLFAPGSRFIVERAEDQTDRAAVPTGHGKVWVWLREIT